MRAGAMDRLPIALPVACGQTCMLAVALSFLIGVSLGLLGGGGSILTVPILVYVLGVEAKEAIAMSLVVVGTTSLFALISHARAGNVAWRTGALFGAAGMAGAYLGGLGAGYLSGHVLLILFSLMTVATAVAMFRGSSKPEQDFDLLEGEEEKPPQHEHPLWRILVDGLVVGIVTGLVGAGGGFLVVPALVLLGGLDMKTGVGTSLIVIAMKSLAGYLGHAAHVHIDVTLTALVTASAVLGSLVGGLFAERIPQQALRKGFAAFVLVLGVLQFCKEVADAVS